MTWLPGAAAIGIKKRVDSTKKRLGGYSTITSRKEREQEVELNEIAILVVVKDTRAGVISSLRAPGLLVVSRY
jgi:hypothetical protein